MQGNGIRLVKIPEVFLVVQLSGIFRFFFYVNYVSQGKSIDQGLEVIHLKKLSVSSSL